jgi:hypothetical protein
VAENDVIEEMRGLQGPSIRPSLAERPSKSPALPTTPRQILDDIIVVRISFSFYKKASRIPVGCFVSQDFFQTCVIPSIVL